MQEPLTNASYYCTACGHTHNASSRIGREHKQWARANQESQGNVCSCGEPEDGGEFGWFTVVGSLGDQQTWCNACGEEVQP
jgi:hypothetical protein